MSISIVKLPLKELTRQFTVKARQGKAQLLNFNNRSWATLLAKLPIFRSPSCVLPLITGVRLRLGRGSPYNRPRRHLDRVGGQHHAPAPGKTPVPIVQEAG